MEAAPPRVPPDDDSDLPPSMRRRRPSDPALSPGRAVLLVLVAFGLLAGAVTLYQVLDTRRHAERPSNRPATLALTGLHYDPATRVITGTVHNRTEAAYRNVRVTFELLDAARTVVGTIRDSSAEVAAGTDWAFRIVVPTPGVRRVRLVDYAATRDGGPRSQVRVLQDV